MVPSIIVFTKEKRVRTSCAQPLKKETKKAHRSYCIESYIALFGTVFDYSRSIYNIWVHPVLFSQRWVGNQMPTNTHETVFEQYSMASLHVERCSELTSQIVGLCHSGNIFIKSDRHVCLIKHKKPS